MRSIKKKSKAIKTLKIIGICILILVFSRGFIYRLLINYSVTGSRTEIRITNQELIKKIESKSAGNKINIEEIIQIANSITTEELRFTRKRTSNDPNVLINTHRANCVGYSAMFNSIANYLIRKNKLEKKIRARHKIGKLDFLGIDLHQFFQSPFFRDHDFNQIKNLETRETFYIDPTVSDYLWIKKVCSRN